MAGAVLLAGFAAPGLAGAAPSLSKASLPVAAPAAISALATPTLPAAGAIADPTPGLLAPIAKFTTKDACAAAAGVGQASCMAEIVTPLSKVESAATTLPSGFGPADLDSAYDVNTSLGAGETVAIVDAYNDPTAASDLAAYRSEYGLPACTVASGCFKQLNQSGATSPLPANSSGWTTEESLDVDMVSAICPLCHIDLIEGTTSSIANLAAASNEAAALGAVAISNSYGASEFSGESSYDADYDHPGVLTTAASGDGGYGVIYPSAGTDITAVGGTALSKAAGTARGWTETAWSDAGSGCSAYEAKPSWQHDTGCSKRTVADVSAVASPSTPVAIYDTYNSGGWELVGGTSVASPIIASMGALASPDFRATGTAEGFYQMSQGYVGLADAGFGINDVTSGSNGSCSSSAQYLCNAGVGYDGPTGVGSVVSAPRSSIGYVWASEPTTASYTPSSTWSYNSYGATNTVTRSSAGTYTVAFPYLASGGTVNVTAYDSSDHCDARTWYHTGAGFTAVEDVGVECYNTAGAAADSYFDVSFVDPAGEMGSSNLADDSLGFLWANSPTSASYTPSTFYQYNNFNDLNTITRASTGVYTVTFTDLAPVPTTDQGTVKVSAYASSDYCVSSGWSQPSTSSYNESVGVDCFNTAGAPADSEFTVTYSADLALTGTLGAANAYLWASSPTSTTAYDPASTWSFNSTGGTNSITRTSTGDYTVTLPGLTTEGGDVQVTAYGSSAASCRTNGWGSSSSGTTIYVQCVNASGSPVDDYFNLQYFYS